MAQVLSLTWVAEIGSDTDSAALSLCQMRHLKRFHLYLHHPDGDVTADSKVQYAVACNQLVRSVSGMERIEDLRLFVLCSQGLLLAPLTGLTQLRVLFLIASTKYPCARPSAEQVDALRQMHTIERFGHKFSDRNGTLQLVMQPPTPPLRWTSALVDSNDADDLRPILLLLPSLTSLDVELKSAAVGFLLSLPCVSSLSLSSVSDDRALSADVHAALVSTLTRCPWITSLHLVTLPWTSAELGALLAVLPRTSELTLDCMSELTSLSFLHTVSLAASLTSLSLCWCPKVASTEVEHVLSLPPLRVFHVIGLREPLSLDQQRQLRSIHTHGLICQ